MIAARPWLPTCLLLGAAVVMWTAEARGATVVVFKSAAAPPYDQVVGAIRATLSDQDVRLEDLAGDRSRVAAAAARARASAAVVIAVGPLALEAARASGKPVVYVLVPEPSLSGLGQATGVRMGVAPARNLSLMKRLLPRAHKVAIVYNPARSSSLVGEAREAARRLGLQLAETRVENERAVPFAVRGLRADALWLFLDDTVVTRTSYPLILRATLTARIPTLTFSQEIVRAGALAALEADFADSGRKAAALVRQLLGGRSCAELPPVYPDARLHVNDRVAQQLSVTIPPELRRFVGQVLPP